ncbi:MAG: CvpA family protein [Nitrospinae bacterium]|nr:CvpA family protein [Nitrospinota bacterium]
MSWFDIFTIFFLTASAIWSYHRGFFKEAFSLLAIVAGFWVASRHYSAAAPFFREWVSEKMLADAAAFLTLFILTAIFISVTGTLARRILRISAAMSFVDRVVGGGLGVAKGALILAVVTYPLALIPGLKDDLVKGSVAAPILMGISNMALEKLAPGLAHDLDKAAKKTVEMKDRAKKIGEGLKFPVTTTESPEKKEKEPVREPKNAGADHEGKPKESPQEPAKAPASKKTAESQAKPAKTAPGKSPSANGKDTLSNTDRKELDQLLDKLDKPRAK